MSKERYTFYTLFAVLIAALGGFLFGYQIAAVSGAILFIGREFDLTPLQEGWVVSLTLIGALLGSLCAGILADRYGRKRSLLFTATIFIFGTLLITASSSHSELLLGRAISGIAVGLASLIVPLYLAEISPPHSRGAFVSLNQLAITIGILAAYLINYAYADVGNWRIMFAWGMLPAALLLFCGFFLPETPAWLLAHGKEHRAISTLRKLRRDRQWQSAISEMKRTASPHKKAGWRVLLQPRLRFVLFLGLSISTFQQITGINTVIYYAPKIFTIAGFSSVSTAILATVGIGIINVLATLFSVWLLDRLGRRPLLLIGIAGMIASLCALSLAFYSKTEAIDLIAVISLMSYVAFFAIGLGPITWLILSEIYPLVCRGKAMTLAGAVNWFFNYLVSFLFLDLIQALGTSWTFLLFAAIGVLALFVITRFMPETKNKRLEEIEAELVK